jgi:hypothetical protein
MIGFLVGAEIGLIVALVGSWHYTDWDAPISWVKAGVVGLRTAVIFGCAGWLVALVAA